MAFPFDSFSIGAHSVDPPLVLAPMHEITDMPFRRMVREVGGVGLTVSEMVSCEALVRGAHKAEAMLAPDGGRPFAVQLAGAVPERLAEAARLVEAAGADMVDLNMGCPASNVTKGGAGSALMRDFPLATACIRALVRSVKIPVTVKMRAGWDVSQKDRGEYLDFIRMFEAEGVQALALHPRTRSQQYLGHADWSLIGQAVALSSAFPVIGNGDILTAEDAHRMVQETGCQGVMIGRGVMYNPYLFRQILDRDLLVTANMRIDTTLRYFAMLRGALDVREALHKIKKIGGLFTKGLPGGARFRQRLQDLNDPDQLMAEIAALKSPV